MKEEGWIGLGVPRYISKVITQYAIQSRKPHLRQTAKDFVRFNSHKLQDTGKAIRQLSRKVAKGLIGMQSDLRMEAL